MDMKLSVSILAIVFTAVSPQFQNVQVPPGAFVELEFEFINQQPGAGGQQGGSGAGMGQGAGMAGGGMPGGGAGGSPAGMGIRMPGMRAGQMHQMMAPSQMMPPMSGASPMMQGMMPGMQPEMMPAAGSMMAQMMPTSQMMPGMQAGGAPSSPIQQLLSNMVQTVTSLRQMYGFNMPMPPMEEPCPCDADCCKLPTEPRRLLPVLEIPMVMHRGCCGCVDCPHSLSPLINGMVQAAQMATSQQGPPPDL